jgi:hypothetical protein
MSDAVSERLLDHLFAEPGAREEEVERTRSSVAPIQIGDLVLLGPEGTLAEGEEEQDQRDEPVGASSDVLFFSHMLGRKRKMDYSPSEAMFEGARTSMRRQVGLPSVVLNMYTPQGADTPLWSALGMDAEAPLRRFSAKAAEMLDAREVAELARALEEALETARPAELHPALEGLELEPLSVAERIVVTTEGVGRRLGFEREQIAASDSAEQTAVRLGVSLEQLTEMREKGELVALESKRGGWYYPRWQFAGEGSTTMLAGLSAVLEALGEMAPLVRVAWLCSAKPALGGRSPLEALKTGDHDTVRRLARSARALAG